MPMNARVQGFLEGSRIPYEVVAHSQAFTAQGVAHVSHVSGWQVAKVVIVRPPTGAPLMAVLPASCRVDLERLEAASGAARLSLAPEFEVHDAFPDCETGAMPPFGNLYGLRVFVDAHLAREPELLFQAGNHREAVRMRWADFERAVRPVVAEFCRGAHAA
jgi:Ala-tRNA(Pro) deacylase